MKWIVLAAGLLSLGGGNGGGTGPSPVVQAATFTVSSPVSNGGTVGTATATNSPTGWSITGGDPSGDFAISSSGVITFTAQGHTDFAGSTNLQTATLTLSATNSGGSGTGNNTVNAYADGSVNAATGTIQFQHLLDLQKVTALNVIAGSGYTNGTGLSLTATGCSGSGFAGTVDVAGGQLINPVISNEGSGYTCRPTIAVPAGAGAGSGGSIIPTVYQARPVFKVPGVDYYVGIPSGTTLSAANVQGNLPSGATFTVGASQNFVDVTSNNVTLNALDFCAGSGTGIFIGANITGTVITNSSFCTTSKSTGGGVSDIIVVASGSGGLTFKNNNINGEGTNGNGSAIGASSNGIGAVQSTGTGALIVEYNYCFNMDQHCLDLSLGSGITNSAGNTIRWNLGVNMGMGVNVAHGAVAHGEFEYFCGGTYSNVNVAFNTGILQFLNLSNSASFTLEPDNTCGGAGAINNASLSYNVSLSQGTQAATGSLNGTSQVSGSAFHLGTSGGSFSSTTVTGNYIDYTGAFQPFYSGAGSSGPTYSGNINAVTGNECSLASCN